MHYIQVYSMSRHGIPDHKTMLLIQNMDYDTTIGLSNSVNLILCLFAVSILVNAFFITYFESLTPFSSNI